MAKEIQTRIKQKHDTEANWNSVASTFTPEAGELIIYDADASHPYSRIKVGDGKTAVGSLPFVVDAAKVTVTNTTPTGVTMYYPLYTPSVSGSQTVCANKDLYYYDAGSWSSFNIGSSDQLGILTLHAANGKYVDISAPTSLTNNPSLTLPNASGTIATTDSTVAQANKIKVGNDYYELITTTDESSTGAAGKITFVLEGE